jgi:UDP-GlcNAc3NAcA epimerase
MNLVTIVGARPQFIKAGPVSAALAAAGIHERLLHTGQHYDDALSARFFTELGLPAPAANLGVGSGPHGAQTARMLTGIEERLLEWRPDVVLVYGDTNSTLAGALAAAKLHLPVAHIEAGLRSRNRAMPEEINRVVTDHLSARLYCPSAEAAANLADEGITTGVHVVGDVMHDAVRHYRPLALANSDILRRLHLEPRAYHVATLHRAELTDHPALLATVLATLSALPLPVVLPLHPRTRARLESTGWHARSNSALRLLEPLGYLDMLALVASSERVLTDSGGLQKEAYWLERPCLTLRAETEWIETVSAGWNTLVPPASSGFDAALRIALARPAPPLRPALYGEGDAAPLIAADLARAFTP